MAMVAVDDSCL